MSSESICKWLHRALSECHRRFPSGPGRDTTCRHLHHTLAMCIVSLVCQEESNAIQALCSSNGIALKRSQCQHVHLSLFVCLSASQRIYFGRLAFEWTKTRSRSALHLCEWTKTRGN
ncbi:hypothetical protein QN277_012476 [Acacia crassicarpa]|uniref:COX assembly mitochondrial protein n=1 Tax=Acacia crassicarpa TaxID=499986 RepID=A0AAE1TEN4_9FABA|nr:hypothetical protein QN277_012476 [Acacia crassicarpa]